MTPITTTVELDTATAANLGTNGGYRQNPTINNQTSTSAIYPAKIISTSNTGTNIQTIRAITITAYPTYNPNNNNPTQNILSATNPTNPTHSTNPTNPTNPTEPQTTDISISTSIILTFNAISKTIYTLNQPSGPDISPYLQMQICNWTGYLNATPKGTTNIIPYNGALAGENKTTTPNLKNTTITFTTTNTAKTTNGITAIWTYKGQPINKETHDLLTRQGYNIPLPGNTGYAQSNINLLLTLSGPTS
jgi:hypothetical protein